MDGGRGTRRRGGYITSLLQRKGFEGKFRYLRTNFKAKQKGSKLNRTEGKPRRNNSVFSRRKAIQVALECLRKILKRELEYLRA